jgi:hypothetical protein
MFFMRNKYIGLPFMLKFFLLASLIAVGSYTKQSVSVGNSLKQGNFLQQQSFQNDSTVTTPIPAPEPTFRPNRQPQAANYSK